MLPPAPPRFFHNERLTERLCRVVGDKPRKTGRPYRLAVKGTMIVTLRVGQVPCA